MTSDPMHGAVPQAAQRDDARKRLSLFGRRDGVRGAASGHDASDTETGAQASSGKGRELTAVQQAADAAPAFTPEQEARLRVIVREEFTALNQELPRRLLRNPAPMVIGEGCGDVGILRDLGDERSTQ